jgi:hypothetical protein
MQRDSPVTWFYAEKNSNFLKCPALKTLERDESNRTKPSLMMNLIADNRMTETGNLTNHFVFPTGFGSQNMGHNPLSPISREQLAAFLNAASGNARSAHFSVPPSEPTPPPPEKGLAVGVLKQAAYDLRRFRTATKSADRELYLDAHSWVTAYDSSWPYSFMNVCKLLGLCPEVVRAELLADAALGPFHYWIRRAGRLSRKLGASVAHVFESCRNPEPVEGKHLAASIWYEKPIEFCMAAADSRDLSETWPFPGLQHRFVQLRRRLEGILCEGVAAKHIITMKFSTEAIVAVAVGVVFALLAFGAIAREQGEPRRGGQNAYVAATNLSLSQLAASETDVLGFY